MPVSVLVLEFNQLTSRLMPLPLTLARHFEAQLEGPIESSVVHWSSVAHGLRSAAAKRP
jgi:hypothetical protein